MTSPAKTHVIGFIVGAAVDEHLPEVCYALFCTVIHVIVQLLLDGSHVHRVLDDVEIILNKNMETE